MSAITLPQAQNMNQIIKLSELVQNPVPVIEIKIPNVLFEKITTKILDNSQELLKSQSQKPVAEMAQFAANEKTIIL